MEANNHSPEVKPPDVNEDGEIALAPTSSEVFCIPTADLVEIGDCTPLWAAFVKAKLEWPTVLAASTGQEGHRKFAYADMADIGPIIDPHLAKHGLVPATPLTGDMTDKCRVSVILAHVSGARLVANLYFSPMQDIKKFAGQSTLLARYMYCKLLGIAAEEDPNKNLDAYTQQPERPSQQQRQTRARQAAQKPAQKPAETKQAPKQTDDRQAVAKSLNPLFRACGINGRIAAAAFANEILKKQPHEASVEELLKLKAALEGRIAAKQAAETAAA